MNQVISIPTIIGEREIPPAAGNSNILLDLFGDQTLEIRNATEWDLSTAIECASAAQEELHKISIDTISRVLRRAMDFYFDTPWKFQLITRMSGSPLHFVVNGIEFMKSWCRDLEAYHRRVLGNDGCLYTNSAPLVGILPGNSEQESLYVIAQTLLSRNALILRSSGSGPGAFTALEFHRAFARACHELDPDTADILLGAVSLVSTHSGAFFLENTLVDGWNYIHFGSDSTVRRITRDIQRQCVPRRVIGYGTGLSTAIVLSHDVPAPSILDAVSVNCGNECISTDIIYCHESIFEELLQRLRLASRGYRTGDPFAPDSIGLMHPANFDFTYGELCIKRGKLADVALENGDARPLMHASIVPLNRYESTLEYPAPVAAMRPFADFDELRQLVAKDLHDNEKDKNLVTSVFSHNRDEFEELLPLLRTHTAKWNVPTHVMDMGIPHQGMHLVRELAEPMYIQN